MRRTSAWPLSLIVAGLACQPARDPLAQAKPSAACHMTPADTAEWHRIDGGLPHIVFAVPQEFVTDASPKGNVTYYGAHELSAPPRRVYYFTYANPRLGLGGEWSRDSVYQTADWPRLGPGWRTRIVTSAGPMYITTAWFAGPAEADLYGISALSLHAEDSTLLRRILCTARLSNRIRQGGA